MPKLDLPYFDQILGVLERDPRSDLARAFKKHVHWGAYESPDTAGDSTEAYVAAAERLTRLAVDAARVRDGMRVLDVGCGFGGTVDHVNERFARVDVTGLNIDSRQLEHARAHCTARGENRVAFVESDACALPFGDGSFDAVLAVECIFHFASRERFLAEVRRVLAPGGRLAITDFVLNGARVPLLALHVAKARLSSRTPNRFYGKANAPPITAGAYAKLAKKTGFAVAVDDDISASTLPTYAAMRRIYRDGGLSEGARTTEFLEGLARGRFVRYHVMAFEPLER